MQKAIVLIALILVGCGDGGSTVSKPDIEASEPWPIQVSIRQDNYIHIEDAYINGVKTDCVFDTGAPRGIYLPNGGRVVAVVGNYERTLDANLLWPEATFLDCIVGMRFLEGATEYRIDLEQGLLEVR